MAARYADNAEKNRWLRRIFDETAPDYDRVESWLSFGSGRWYRRRALQRAGLSEGMTVADVACGTGLVAREAAAIVGLRGRILGVDPSEGMLRYARRIPGLETAVGVADSLPCGPSRFDFLSMGYALRHVEDLHAAFSEFLRVLRPGGKLCILEISRPDGRIRRALLRGYMRVLSSVLPRITHAAPRTRELWRYYWETIELCVPPGQIVGALREAGFERVQHRMELGLFSEYTGIRPVNEATSPG